MLVLAIYHAKADEAEHESSKGKPAVDTRADRLEFSRQSNILSAIGNVRIQYRDIVIKADEVSLNYPVARLYCERPSRAFS